MIYWKWREHTSSGVSTWKYRISYATTKDELQEELSNAHLLSDWSEHFRRIEAKQVSRLPVEFLDEKIADAQLSSRGYAEKANELKALKEKWYGKKAKTDRSASSSNGRDG